jgi:hypothetical protein
MKKCVGKARVLGGNPRTVGKQGAFPGVVVNSTSAAVIPQQFAGSKGQLTPYIDQISGTTLDGSPIFDGITDVIGGKSPIPGTNVRDALADMFPDDVIVELPGGDDMGVIDIIIWVPRSDKCPIGTKPVSR